jgi:elongation factor G
MLLKFEKFSIIINFIDNFIKGGIMSLIKNIAIIGHTGEGKTTLAEAMLFNSGVIDRIGKVETGNTVMDYEEQEIQRKISISMSLAYLKWKDCKINIIDVPGFFDFEGELVEALSVCDCALVLVSAAGTISVGSEKAIDYCLKQKIPFVIFINQMDKENADYHNVVGALREKYKNKIAPVEIPIMEGTKMKGYIDVLEGKSFLFSENGPVEIKFDDKLMEEYTAVKTSLTETAAENDDVLLEKYFAEGKLSDEEIVGGIKKGIHGNNAIPVLAGSGMFNKGVINLMNFLVKCMPGFNDKDNVTAFDGEGKEITLKCGEDEPFTAFVFKTVADPFVGKMNLFKVLSGRIKTGMTVYNSSKDKQERINSILILKGKKQESVESLCAGDIGAFAKLQYTATGDTLCDVSLKVKLPALKFPLPVLSMAAYSQKSGDEDKIFSGLNRLMEEDATFSVTKNMDTGEMLINGLGEMHIDVITKKLKSKFGAEVLLKTPKIAYKETIKTTSLGEGKHKKQSGGHGQYGHCKVRFEPYPEGDFKFDDEVVGGTVPKQYIPAVEKGLKESITKGVLAGYPVINLKAVLYDGSYHEVDSSEESFKIAAHLAFKDGIPKANPVLLEPIYKIEVIVPENYIGDILGDLNKKRGRIQGLEGVEKGQKITAEAPLAEIFRYATDLRSITQGRGSFSTEFLRYDEIPKEISDKIIQAYNDSRAE